MICTKISGWVLNTVDPDLASRSGYLHFVEYLGKKAGKEDIYKETDIVLGIYK